jgi:hypothetical protein
MEIQNASRSVRRPKLQCELFQARNTVRESFIIHVVDPHTDTQTQTHTHIYIYMRILVYGSTEVAAPPQPRPARVIIPVADATGAYDGVVVISVVSSCRCRICR